MNAYEEGKQAARQGMSWGANPYIFDSENARYERWMDGWHDEKANKSKDTQPDSLDD